MAIARKEGHHGKTWFGVIEEAKFAAREKRDRRKNKPQPWIVQKFAIGLTVAIVGYSAYVYIGRLCVPMILRKSNALGSRAIGIAFLVVHCVILLMMTWAYLKVVITAPGNAKEIIAKSERPIPSSGPYPGQFPSTAGNFIAYGASHGAPDHPPAPGAPYMNETQNGGFQGHTIAESAEREVFEKSPPQTSSSQGGRTSDTQSDSRLTSLQPTSAQHGPDADVAETLSRTQRTGQPYTTAGNASGPANFPPLERRPPTTPTLLPEYRYCSRCEILKPYRTHHCRACGTCVLRYDHHCPWIGQCVGARNHKFFLIFLEWGTLYCLWVFSTLVGLVVKASSGLNYYLDPQKIVTIVLASLFLFLTGALLISHIFLMLLNQTSLESVISKSMMEQEGAQLGQRYAWYSVREKKRVKNQWDREWGMIRFEGNLWWLGSTSANWESMMGKNPWSWFLPIGHSPSDGLVYPRNPRFDQQGRWRPRREWPPHLQ